MRSKNAVKNLMVSLLYQAFIFIAGMIVPRFIILNYGSAINGLTSSINRVLTIMNLIQAGAVGTAVYQMYKPVAEDDFETQSSIIYASTKFYNRIGKIYIFLACIISVIYGLYLQDDSLSVYEIILSFLILAGNGCIYLFFGAKYDIVFSSYQKRYLLIIGSLIEKIIYFSLLVIVFIWKMHFIFMYVAMSIGSLVSLIFNTYMFKKITHNRITKNPKNKDYIIPDRGYLMVTSIAVEGISALPTIIITSILGLVSASVFSIYQMIYSLIRTIINSVQLSISAVFGNLVASEKPERVSEVYKLLELIFIMLGTFLASCTAFLFLSFVRMYTAGINDANYINKKLILFSVLYIIIYAFRTSFGYIATIYGLFKDICKNTLVFGGIGMMLSVFSTMLFGLPYVMIGLLFHEVFYSVFTLIIIHKKIGWFSYRKLFQRILVLLVMPLTFYLGGLKEIVLGNDGWFGWFITAIMVAVISLVLIFVYCVLFERKELILLFSYLENLIRKREKRYNV